MARLYPKTENQENDEDSIKKDISQLIREPTKKRKPSYFSEDAKSLRKVSKRSVQVGDNSDSFWSKAQLSSLELGSMQYDNYAISIYAHPNNNAQRENTKKQFYYSPMAHLLHKSAEASFNNITKHHEVTFGIQMWTEEVEDQARKYTEKLVKHLIEPEKIRILPIEMVKLSISGHQSPSYQLKDQWIFYIRDKVLSFKLTCPKSDTCQRLADEMRSSPQQFNHLFRLDFTTSAHTLKSQEITIKMGTIADGSLLSKLIQRYPEERDIFLTAEDELRLLNEAKTNIIASLGDSFHLDSTSEEKIGDLIKTLLIESRGKMLNESKGNVIWNGKEFIPKPILVSKLNRVKLSEMKSLPDKKTIISFSRVMLSSGVNIQANYKEEDRNQISQLKSKLEDLQAKINTAIPKEIQGMYVIVLINFSLI